MAEPAKEEKEKKQVVDDGIEVGVSQLTPEKIQAVINGTLQNRARSEYRSPHKP